MKHTKLNRLFFLIKKCHSHSLLALVLLLIHFRAYSSECLFEAKVHPPEKTEATKELYHEACRFFIKTFGVKLNPKIKLNNVHYVEKEEDWQPLIDAGIVEKIPHGVFYSLLHDPEVATINDIYINTDVPPEIASFTEDEIAKQSIVFHEFIHFFIKSANFEYVLEKNIEANRPMEEALCYWAQNKYIERTTRGRDNITDYMTTDTETEGLTLSNNFPSIAPVLKKHSMPIFIYNSIYFFNDDTKAKYNKLINNEYSMTDIQPHR